MPIWKVRDIYEIQLREIFCITHPFLKQNINYRMLEKKFLKKRKSTSDLCGNWIYFPWNGILLHTVNEKEYFELRTNRNKNLITQSEQNILAKSVIAVFGLSVGSHVATALAYNGIGSFIKLAEFDTLDTTNLNRIRAQVDQIGEQKISITAQQIYEINPYASLKLYPHGLMKNNLADIIVKKPIPNIIFEMIDSFEMKIHLRLKARKLKIPVVSLWNIGDQILIDIERYDLHKNLPLFNGAIGNVPERILNNPDVTDAMKHQYAVSLAGKKNIPKRAIESILEIGKTLIGRPQLMSTVSVSGGLSVFFAKQILLGKLIKSGRKIFKFDDLMA